MCKSEVAAGRPASTDWGGLTLGTPLTVVKLAPDGAEAARYAVEVAAIEPATMWVGLQATWSYPPVELDGLLFCTSDRLMEWFSPRQWFNAFAVYTPEGELRGWYANVTYPPRLDISIAPAVLTWQDLYLDLVGLSDGRYSMRDEDELRDSGLAQRDPQLHRQIIGAMHEITRRWRRGLPPFAPPAGQPKSGRFVPKTMPDAQP